MNEKDKEIKNKILIPIIVISIILFSVFLTLYIFSMKKVDELNQLVNKSLCLNKIENKSDSYEICKIECNPILMNRYNATMEIN